MWYQREYHYEPKYEWSSRNQHGDRYEKKGERKLEVAILRAQADNAEDLRALILLADQLNVPVRYDYDAKPQKAYIKIISAEALSNCI